MAVPLTCRFVDVDEPIPSYVPRWIRPMFEAHREHERRRRVDEETTIIRTGIDFGADFVTPEAARGLVGQRPMMNGRRARVVGARALPDGRVEVDLEVPQDLVDEIGLSAVRFGEFSVGPFQRPVDRLLGK